MFPLDYCKISCFSLYLSFTSSKNLDSPLDTFPEHISSSFQIADVEAPQQTTEQSTVAASKSSEEKKEKNCGVCFEKIYDSVNDDELKNSPISEKYAFLCPNQKESMPFCYECIDTIYKNCTRDNSNAEVLCPGCRTDLKDSFKNFRVDFIRKFATNPEQKMVETLGLILSDFDGSDIFEVSLKDDLKLCKKILDLIKNLSGENVNIIKNIVQSNINELQQLQKIPNEDFDKLCFEIENDPENAHPSLNKNSHIINLLTLIQMTKMIERVINIKFDNKEDMIISIEVLILSISNKYLKMFSGKIFFKISMICLNSKTVAGLELFTRLNTLVEQVSNIYINEIFKTLDSMSDEFESDLVFFEACKSFVVGLSRKNSSSSLVMYISRLPPNVILEKDFAFLKKHFDEDIIVEATAEFIKNPKVFKKASKFYFENNFFRINFGSLKYLILNCSVKNFSNPDLISKEDLEYFMTYLINVSDIFIRIDVNIVKKLIITCIIRNLPINILNAFEKFIFRDYIVDEIAGFENGKYAQSFFKILNEMKRKNKEDYQWLNLTSRHYFFKKNLELLEKILKPENIAPALKIICGTPGNFVQISDKNRKIGLCYLIEIIVKNCPERREILSILTDSLPDKFKFLVKTYFIVSFNSFKLKNLVEVQVVKKLKEYLLQNLKLTTDLKEKLNSDLDILDYFNIVSYDDENFDELRSIIETIEINCLSNIYEGKDWKN